MSLGDGTHIFESRTSCFRARYRRCRSKCLPPQALIDTPRGAIALHALQPGDAVFTRNKRGDRVVGRVLKVVATEVRGPHDVARVQLEDGRELVSSLRHPLAGSGHVEDLRPGVTYAQARIVDVEILRYPHSHTYDFLPSGPTGVYWADGVPLKSTLSTDDEVKEVLTPTP